MYFNVERIVRGYYAYQSVLVAVGEELPCKREQANSDDPFTVAVTTGELIIGCEKCPQCPRCVYDDIMGQFSVELLDQRLDDNVLDFLTISKKFVEEAISVPRNFREHFCLAKISHYTVYSQSTLLKSSIVCHCLML